MTVRRGILILAMLLLSAQAGFAAEWSIGVDDANGLPVLKRGGAIAAGARFAFWGKAWSWAPMSSRLTVRAPIEYSLAGSSPAIGVELEGRAIRVPGQGLDWAFDFTAASASEAIGGGVVFDLDLALGAEMGEPELLPGNAGWTWGKGAQRIEIRVQPAAAWVYFERGRKNEIRVFFYKDRIPPGKLRHALSLRVPDAFAVVPTQRERFGLDRVSAWPAVTVDVKGAAVDLSFLNWFERPAGKRGFMATRGEDLVFDDGTSARFWGTNLTAHAIFMTPTDEVRRQARRLSQLGYNLVRLHHHDSYWVRPNVFGDGGGPDTRSLSAAMLDKIDWWIQCLKEEGIYVWLDLHVQRQFTSADGIEEFDEVGAGKPVGEPKGFSYINRSVMEAMKRFNQDYLTHRSQYSGLRLVDDPAIVAVLITNENDLTHHYGNSFLPDKQVPRHNDRYMAAAAAFARKHGLSAERTWRSWEHGPSKMLLNDLEHRFNAEMIAHLRGLGVRVPIATTSSWGRMPVSSLPALSDGDIIDVHSYGGAGQLERDPRHTASLLHWIAAAQVVGKPLAVSEWNAEPFPLPDRHVLPVALAAMASHQGWDALMHYAYSQVPLGTAGVPSIWGTYNDPAYIPTMSAAALLYRQSQLRPATTTLVYAPGREAFFGTPVSAGNSPGLRTAAEQGRLLVALPATPELPWLRPVAVPRDAVLITDPKAHRLPGANEVVTDTGEIRRNWEDGTLVINSPYAQAALGWIGGRRIALADVEIAVAAGHASVIVQSRDGKAIADSRDIVITATGVVQPTGEGLPPYRRAPVDLRLRVRAPAGLRLAVAESGSNVPMMYRDGSYLMQLNDQSGAVQYRLRSP
jgi:hypothetical protein